MGTTKRRRRMPAPLADDPLADDRGLAKRKLRQLCRQVERAVSTALGEDDVADDDLLLDLMVTTVLPWPNASRLLIVVEPAEQKAEIDRDAVIERLQAIKSSLREVVAGAIHRKRTPELCFEVFRPDAGAAELDPELSSR